MARGWGRLALRIVLTIALALLLGMGVQAVALRDPLGGAVEGARLLVFFQDVGVVAWVLGLVVLTAARGSVGRAGVVLLAVAGVAVNALVILIVGSLQGGDDVALFEWYGLLAGLPFLVAVAVVVRLWPPRQDPRPLPPAA